MKQIPLSSGHVALVDDVDFDFLSSFVWHGHKKRSGMYAVRNLKVDGRWKMEYLHRLLMGDASKMPVDHINHNTLDNQKQNLRVCSTLSNTRNRKGVNKNSTSGIRGVTWHKQIGRWLAQIKVNRKNIYIGVFLSKEDAGAAYAVANKKYFGEFGGGL